ncbi:MAG TPA: ComEA family DNA-binding protein [Gemmataceae bacterium]|nr:ComEA family DNA-binding protein [Gemmataceae bacterium]
MNAAASSTPAVVPPPAPSQTAPPWPKSAQLALVFLLGVGTTLLVIHGCRGLRWGSRPTELERNARSAYRIDLNRSDEAELMQTPGIGPRKAARIVESRHQQGAFSTVADLKRVQGIGPATLGTLQPWVVVQRERMNPDPNSEDAPMRPSQAPAGRGVAGKKEIQPGEQMNINLAAAADLQRLPGIGPKRAQLIVEERQKRPFASIEDLRRVSGIGAKTLERLRPYIHVGSGPLHIVTADGS